jgi:hypothetical protein
MLFKQQKKKFSIIKIFLEQAGNNFINLELLVDFTHRRALVAKQYF